MPFQIKDFASIAAAEINHARAVSSLLTDYQPGSAVRTILEAPAVEMEELYLQMFMGLRDAIPVSTFLSFGFDQLQPAYAAGIVTVSSSPAIIADTPIPIGTEFYAADGRVYRSTELVVWAQGSTQISIPVAHSVAGLVGNVAAGGISSAPIFSGSAFAVSNLPITSGRDLESFAEREARFADYIRSLSRGTVVACSYAARMSTIADGAGNVTEYVTRSGLTEEPGHVRIYIYSNLGVPSDALLADGQRRIDGWRDEETGAITEGYRSAGVRVDVLPMVERAVSLSFAVSMVSGFSITPAVIQSLTDIAAAALADVPTGDTLYLGTLVELMLAVQNVLSIVPTSNSNIVCAENEALSAGVVTITALV